MFKKEFIIKGIHSAQNKRRPQQEHLVNGNIPFPKVFVVDQNNEKVGVLPIAEAIERAREVKMDLVLISVDNSGTKPKPITRILDYGKFKYDRKKKQKESKEKQTFVQNREIRLTPRINDNDINTKAKKVRDFLLEGDRVKISLKFRGRELTRPELGKEVLDKFFSYVEDIAKKTKEPEMNERFLDMYLELDKKKKPLVVKSAPKNKNEDDAIKESIEGEK